MSTTPFPLAVTPRFVLVAARASVVATLFSLLVLLGLHVAEPELSPLWQFISEYALGRFGIAMNLAFFGLAVGLISLGLTMWFHARTVTGRIGIVLTMISSAGMLMAALFNTDPSGMAEQSTSGFLHNIGGQLNLTPYAALFLTLGLRKNAAWNRLKVVLPLLVAVILIGELLFIVTASSTNGEFGPGSFTALIGRLELLAYLAWQLVAVIRTRC